MRNFGSYFLIVSITIVSLFIISAFLSNGIETGSDKKEELPTNPDKDKNEIDSTPVEKKQEEEKKE